MNNVKKTVDLFPSRLNCPQAMLTVFGESYGLDSEMAEKLGRLFGGGMGHMAGTCGAVTGAVLVLGLAKDHEDEGEGSNARESDANNPENTVHFFPERDVDNRRARSGFEMAVERIVAGIEVQTAYLIVVSYRVVGRTRYRRFGKR